MLVVVAFASAIALALGCSGSADVVSPVERTEPETEQLTVRVIRSYPHATDAFTQGLLWHAEQLYESTGLYGQSSLRRVSLRDGEVLDERKLPSDLFGEGLARVENRLVQLTWKSEIALVSDIDTLAQQETFRYAGEGWGLCFNGDELVMSDGSSILDFRDPSTMELLREVSVLRDGDPVSRLNELECVGEHVYANVWQSDEIVRIEASTGEVTANIDASFPTPALVS